MKKNIHPDYHAVVFEDPGAGFRLLTRSTMTSEETIKWEDGKTYPLIRLEISKASHPVYTGKQKLIDTAGRVDKFQARTKRAAEMKSKASSKAAKKDDQKTDKKQDETEKLKEMKRQLLKK